MRARPTSVYHDRAQARLALLVAGPAALSLFAILFLAAGASAATINEQRTLQEGEYFFLGLQDPYPGQDWVIDVNWTATDPIDMWVMNKTDFHAYEANLTFGFVDYHQGSNHRTLVTIAATRAAEEPFYLVFDNTDKGNNQPVADPGNHVPHIVVTGTTQEYGAWSGSTTGPRNDPLGLALNLLMVLIPVAIVAIYLVVRRKRKQRLTSIKARLMAGEVVGEKRPPPPPPVMKAPPPAPTAPNVVWPLPVASSPTYRQSALPAPTQPSYKQSQPGRQSPAQKAPPGAARGQPTPSSFCSQCGSQVSADLKFCRGCGAPV